MDDIARGANIAWQRIAVGYAQFNRITAIATELHRRPPLRNQGRSPTVKCRRESSLPD